MRDNASENQAPQIKLQIQKIIISQVAVQELF